MKKILSRVPGSSQRTTNPNHKDKLVDIEIGDVVIIKGELKLSTMEVGRCRKVKLWERQRHQRSWITNIKKLSKTADTVIVPNGITLEHY